VKKEAMRQAAPFLRRQPRCKSKPHLPFAEKAMGSPQSP